jgi:hypothetical protein
VNNLGVSIGREQDTEGSYLAALDSLGKSL